MKITLKKLILTILLLLNSIVYSQVTEDVIKLKDTNNAAIEDSLKLKVEEILQLKIRDNKPTEKVNKAKDSIRVALQLEIDNTNFRIPIYSNKQNSYTVTEVPNPKNGKASGYISDPNDYITTDEELELNRLIWHIEKTTTAQVAIVILPSIGSEVPKDFAVKLFKKWGIGQADTDNGLLILTIMDQRRTELETGYGLEPILTDAICYRIGKQEIVPHFKKGNYGKGLIAAVERVKLFLEEPEAAAEIYSKGVTHNNATLQERLGVWYYILFGYLLLCLIASLVYFGLIYDIDKSINDYHAKYVRLEKFKIGCLLVLIPLPFIFMNALIKRRLKKYRFAPRYSRITGDIMHLKDAWAENEFLEKAQILEEKLKSVAYDVWVTEDESDILILEYKGTSLKYSDCKECSYKTYGKSKTKVITTATYNRSGERIVHYKCRNCNYKEEITEIIPQKYASSSSSSGGGSSSSSGGSSSFGGGSSGGGGAGVSW